MIISALILLIHLFIIFIILITIWALFVFIKNWNKNKLYYKSVIKSIWKNSLSVLIIIVFYVITFGFAGGLSSYVYRLRESVDKMAINQQVFQIHIDTSEEFVYSNYLALYVNPNMDQSELSDNYILNITPISEEVFINLINFGQSTPTTDDTYYNDVLWIEEDNLYYEYNGTTYYNAYVIFGGDFDSYISISVYKNVLDAFNNNELYVLLPNNNLTNTEIEELKSENSNYKWLYTVEINYLLDSINEDGGQYLLKGFTNPNGLWRNEKHLYENNVIEEQYYINRPYFYNTGNNSLEEILIVLTSNDPNVYGTGTQNNPYKVVIENTYFEANDYQIEDIQSNEASFVVNGIYFQIIGTAYFPEVMYPVFSFENMIPDVSNQAVLLMNPRAVLNISGNNANYEFFIGFTDIYDSANSYYDFVDTNSKEVEKITQRSEYLENIFRYYLPSFYLNVYSFGTTANDFKFDLESLRVTIAYSQIRTNSRMAFIFTWLFLFIILVVLILLIQKRVLDNSKQFGTLKAIGVSRKDIASSFIIFPVIIILIGGLLSFLIVIPLQNIFFDLAMMYYTLPFISTTISLSAILLIFIIPLFVLVGIAFIIPWFYLRKSTDYLLSSSSNNKPGIILEKTSWMIPKNLSFNNSYKIKSVLKSFGKSSLIFFAVFGSVFLTSFALASVTMVDNLIEDAEQTFNYDYFSVYNDQENYEFYDLSDPNVNPYDTEYEFYASQGLQELIIFEDNYFYSTYYQADYNEDLYNTLGEDLQSAFLATGTIVDQDGNVMYYIPYTQVGYLIYIYLGFSLFSDVDIGQEWQGSTYSLLDMSGFLIYLTTCFIYNLQVSNVEISSLEEFWEYSLNPDYLYDITFNNIYFYTRDDSGEMFASVFSYFDFWNKDYNNYSSFESKETIFVAYDTQTLETFYNIDDEVIQALDNASSEDAIPVITSEHGVEYLDDNFVTDSQGNYVGYLTDPTHPENNMEIKIDVVATYDSDIDIGTITTFEKVEEYYLNQNMDYKETYYQKVWLGEYTIQNHALYLYEDSTLEDLFFGKLNITETLPISQDVIVQQFTFTIELIEGVLIIFAFFALFMGLVLIVIALKEANDKSKRDVALLKAFGYSNMKASILIMSSYIVIIILALLISVPFTLLLLKLLADLLFALTGTTFLFVLTIKQMALILSFIFLVTIVIIFMGVLATRNSNPLDVIKNQNE